ncbi:VWA domain-containing protein [Roseibacillus ishigakijimensis]|uniref:VWA domain-containing protein n=1 Tax=Roseibacillus ishigakijimensis TaxID=454146 RepID=A0A934RMF5_9BACT|nr:VWA domain-containing protein [Roseibacillus ishigakijimensis]MBK1833513.1 VWA domain-containing protein [Roseibacillus ishigakijimensis]
MTDTEKRRWRLLLGESADSLSPSLGKDDLRMDSALKALYDEASSERRGGLGASSPNVSRWLGDIRKYFPSPVVQVMQKDAIERLNLHQLLLEPEILSQAEPDIHLVSTLISMNHLIPDETRETARQVVRKLVAELLKKLEQPTRAAVQGALARHLRNPRPRLNEIDWPRTIRANLKNYQPEYRTIIPEKLIGYGRKGSSLKDVVLCLDQSGSMAASIIYSSIFGAVMASLPTVSTRFVLFDTAVVDLTDELNDPVDLLFGAQLGGGTDIHKALRYCEDQITRPTDTTMVLISDLEEGGDLSGMFKTAARLVESGVTLITLLALSDEGQPWYSESHARKMSSLGVPVFACTPDQFPDLMAAALSKKDLHLWARRQEIKLY